MTPGESHGGARVRVLYLIKVLGPGGAEQLLLTHLRLVDRSVFETHVGHVYDLGGAFLADVTAACDRTIRLSRRNSPRSFGVVGLARLLLTVHYDVVHVHSPVLGSMARLLLRLRPKRHRPRIVTTEHLVWHGYHPATRLVNRLTIRGDDWIFAVSSEALASISVPRPERAELLIHGVDLRRFAATGAGRRRVRDELGLTDDRLLVGCIAHFKEQKNHRLLIEALAELDRRGCDFTCVLAGTGPLESEIRLLVDARGVADRVRFLGIRDDAADLLSAFDVLVLTSLWEGLPVVIMEALAAGCPIVASDVDGIHEALHGSSAAILFDPAATSSPSPASVICDALEMLGRDASARRSMQHAALELSSRFDARRATTVICDRYLELLGRSTDGRPDRHR